MHTLAHSRVHKHGCTPPEHTSCAPVHTHTRSAHTWMHNGCTHRPLHASCVQTHMHTHTHTPCVRALLHTHLCMHKSVLVVHTCVPPASCIAQGCPIFARRPFARRWHLHTRPFARSTEALVLARGSTAVLSVHTHVQAAAPLTHASSTALPCATPVRAMHTHGTLKAPLVRVPWVRMQLLHARVPSPHPRALWNWVKVAAAPMWGTAGPPPPPGAAPLRI